MQHKNFFMVPNRIFDLELKPRDFTVYCCLLRHSDSKDGSCFPSRRVIAKECGMDRKTVDSAIENLSSLGLVKKIQRHREDGTKTSNLYYVASLLE
ncbi:MAG: helix-turn-helix domain-containing protein [Clostridia bacterium]|nr:helix-turn-helix domain-containing protein [Clostridia bacterium]